jgi:hypothetical protein
LKRKKKSGKEPSPTQHKIYGGDKNVQEESSKEEERRKERGKVVG